MELTLDKVNYKPVNFLPNISKIFEKCIKCIITSVFSDYFEKIFLKFKYSFRKGYRTQECLLTMVETCKKIDQGKEYGAFLTDFSNPFDCLAHKIVIAKLHVHGFSIQ